MLNLVLFSTLLRPSLVQPRPRWCIAGDRFFATGAFVCLLFLKGGVPSHGGIRQVDTIVCCFGRDGGEHRQVRSVLFRDCGSSSQRAGPTTQLPPPPPAELVRPPSAATATTTARRTRGGTPVSLEAATLPGCGETLFPRGSGCFNLPRCGLARVRDFFPPSPPLHPSTFMLGRSVCDLCPLLYRTGNVPPPAFFGFPLFLLS